MGWSENSTRSNTRFLYSIREETLTGFGVALTLTVKDCPETHDHWKKAREAFFARMRRMGMVRAHWVTEWQRRGVPHLHCAIWFREPDMGPNCIFHWFEVSQKFGAKVHSQHSAPIVDSLGWFKYLSKHASRGLAHYQRSPNGIPSGWEKTGRMWGRLGDWVVDKPMEFDTSNQAFWAYRRLMRGLVRADARSSGDIRRIKHSRKMLTCHDRAKSSVRGISEWCPQDVSLSMLVWLKYQGHEIEQR